MKILLVYPYFLEDRLHSEEISAVPMGLYYVGALLKAHHFHVEIVNWHDARDQKADIERVLLDKQPDVIGMSVLHANRWGALDIAGMAKGLDPNVTVVFGGIGAASLWTHFLTHFPWVDYIVTGEGEFPFLHLIQRLRNPDGDDVDRLPGIAYRKGGAAVKNPDNPPVLDLDVLPNPAQYFTYAHVALSRGCPGNCNFCGSPGFWGHKVRYHSTDYFVRQLELLVQKGVTFFFVSDDTFTLNKKRVLDVCKAIVQKGLNITWQAISRVNHVDEEVLEWMRLAGCTQISYGVESGSERIRSFFCKSIRNDQVEKAFRLTTRYGILARAYYIYGAPGESAETIGETLELIRKTAPLSAIFYILDIFPGTRLYEDYCDRTGATDDIWLQRVEDILYFQSDPHLTQDAVLAFGERLRNTYYQWLAGFVERIRLVDKKPLYPFHADFLSRLGMTFSHGDYAVNPAIADPDRIAEKLYRSALAYHPDFRAFLGLGIVLQKKNDHKEAIHFLEKGLQVYPQSQPLHICLGISLMNQGEPRDALSHLLKFSNAPEALPHIVRCYEAVGDRASARRYARKISAP